MPHTDSANAGPGSRADCACGEVAHDLADDARRDEQVGCLQAVLSNKNGAYPETDPWNVAIDFAADAIRRRFLVGAACSR